MKALVELVQVGKSFPGVTALADVDLRLRPGSVHALLGENGAGKSTLINILSGVVAPDRGEIWVQGRRVQFADARSARRHGVVTVHQELDLFPDLSLVENVGLEQGLPRHVLGWIDWRLQRRRTREALAAVGESISPSARAGRLTPAQRQLVEIAAAVSQAAQVLVLDEPTSSLSEAEAQVLFGHLRRFRDRGAAILYVSHRLEEVFALADEVTVLRDGRRIWTGPIGESSPRHLIGLMVGREDAETKPIAMRANTVRRTVRLQCRGLTAADGSVRGIDLDVHGGEVLGMYGLIGAGRSEWAQAVFGLRPVGSGEIHVDGRRVVPHGPGQMIREGVALVPEDRLRQGLCRGLSIQLNTVLASLRTIAHGLWLSGTRESERAAAALAPLAVRMRSLQQPVGTLSGGNQQKVVLGRWLGCDPKVLILDEPTRGVDVGSKAEIHALVRRVADDGRAVVLISSELPEVMALSDRVAVFREGTLAATFDPRATTAEQVAATALPVHQELTQRRKGAKQDNSFAPLRLCVSSFSNGFREGALLVFLLLFFGFVQWRTGRFLAAENLRAIATDAALLSFCTVAATLVILAGGLDISLGALMALSAGVAGRLWEQGQPLAVVAAVAVVLGGVGGGLNAALSLVGRVHPIVVTLGTMSLYRGLTLWWMQQDVQIPGSARNGIFTEALGLPLIAWSGLALLVVTGLVLGWTVSGRELFALGSNPAAAHRVGIDRGRVWLKAFTVQGMLAGLAGLLYLARSGGLQPNGYEEKTLEAIAAAVVGGVAITGGRGTVVGVALGCLFLVSLAPACILLHISELWQRTLVGSVMAVAVTVDTLWRKREAAP